MYLYELTDEYLKLLDAIDAGEIPDEAIEDTLAGIEGCLLYTSPSPRD